MNNAYFRRASLSSHVTHFSEEIINRCILQHQQQEVAKSLLVQKENADKLKEKSLIM